jgi:hypothetical protein
MHEKLGESGENEAEDYFTFVDFRVRPDVDPFTHNQGFAPSKNRRDESW